MMRDQAMFQPDIEQTSQIPADAPSRVTQPRFWDALPARWNSDADDTLECCQVRSETHDVKEFLLPRAIRSGVRVRAGAIHHAGVGD
ncbi:hypothetical protein OKW40_007646 [Paraburkholderia sp. RAU6.4a]